MNERTNREKTFHDARYLDGVGARPQDYFYSALGDAKKLLESEIFQCIETGGIGVEIGCSNGENLERLLKQHHFVAYGIDISSTAIEAAQRRFQTQAFVPKLEVMDANNLTYPDKKFDFCFGSGVIHHLQLPQALSEINRVLRPGGKMVFLEPLATNPFIQFYRFLTPGDRSADETPLTPTHIKDLEVIFGCVRLEFFGFCTLAGVMLKRWPSVQATFMRLAGRIDESFFKLPGAWRFAWVVVIRAERTDILETD